MTGNGDFLKTTLVMSIGVIVGGVLIAQVMAMRSGTETVIAALLGLHQGPTINGLPDPLVTGSVGAVPAGKTIILDPCTGMRRN
jgi:hypothetical protein